MLVRALLATVLWCMPAALAAQSRLAVDLTDGSRVIGDSENKTIRIRTEFAELAVPLTNIDTVVWREDRENVSIRFHNGDVLSGGIVPEPIQLQTLFGDVAIDMQHVVALETLAASVRVSPPIHDDLVLYFTFDEKPDGDVVKNRAQDRLHGKLHGAQWVAEGFRGGAFQFRDYEDQIAIADDPALQPQQLTICAWVLPQDSKYSTWRGIVTKTYPSSWSNGFGLARYHGRPDAHFFVNSYSAETASNPIEDEQWTHLAATYDGETMVLYANGVRVSQVKPTYRGGAIQYGPEPLLIGSAANGYNWIGKIDEVMLFSRVLSDLEIERIYDRSSL